MDIGGNKNTQRPRIVARDRKASEPSSGIEAAKPFDGTVQRALLEARQEMLRFLQRRLLDKDEAEEVLQRFSLRAIERASQLRDVASVRGWLGRILASTLVDHQRQMGRRRRRESEIDPDDLANDDAEPDAELDAAVCNCLHRLLPTLKPQYADVVWRADILEIPRDELAATMGISLNNLTVRLHRGRRALRKRLEEMCQTCPIHGFLNCHCDKASQISAAHIAARPKSAKAE